MPGQRFTRPLGVLAVLLMILGALGLSNTKDAAAQEEAAIEATTQAVQNAWNSRDIANFVKYFTEAGFESEFGFSKSDLDELVEFIGDPPIVATASNIVVTGDTAVADVNLDFGVFSQNEHWEFVRTASGWQIDNSTPITPDIPAGSTVVDVELDEYEFNYDPSSIEPGVNVAFAMENVGEQTHEFVLLRITSDAPLLDLLESEDDEPEGVEFLVAAEADPGTSNVAIPGQALAAGRYAVVCFLPAPDGTPHAFLGMVSEFNVGQGGGSASPITPPDTGDGGLIDSPAAGISTASLVFGGFLAMMVILSRARELDLKLPKLR